MLRIHPHLPDTKGMNLVELTVAVGCLSLLVMGSGIMIQSVLSSRMRAESKQELVTTVSNFQNSLRSQANSAVCKDILGQPSGTAFNPNGTSPAQITIDNVTYRDNTQIAFHSANFWIDRLYFSGADQLASTSAFKAYSTTIILEGRIWNGKSWSPVPPRPVSTVAVKVDPAGRIIDCNMAMMEDAETICQSVNGMKWLPNSGTCVQDVAVDSNNNFTCPPDMQMSASGICIPSESNCYVNLLPKDFANGIVTTCASLPSNAVVNYPAGFYPPNAPTPVSQPPTSAPSPTPPPTCTCGSSQVPATTSTTNMFCGVARNVGNKIGGGIDTEGDVEISIYDCVGGNLVSKHKYYEEESDCTWPGRKPVSCNPQGKYCRP